MKLVAILVVVVATAIGTAVVIDAVLGDEGGGGGGTVAPLLAPRAPDVGVRPGSGNVIEEAERAACLADRRVLETALEAHVTVHGTYVDGPGLVEAGLLREAPTTWTVVSDDGFATYRLEPRDPACA